MTPLSWIRLLTAENQRGNLENRRELCLSADQALRDSCYLDQPAVLPDQFLHDRASACRALLYAWNCVKRFRWNCPCGGDRASGFRNRSGAPVRRIGTMGKVKYHQKKAAKNDVSSFTAFFFYRSILFMIISTHWSIPNMLLFNTRS